MVSPLLCASASGSDHFMRSCAHWMYSCTKYDGCHRKESDGETPHMNDPLFSCPHKTMPKCILMHAYRLIRSFLIIILFFTYDM